MIRELLLRRLIWMLSAAVVLVMGSPPAGAVSTLTFQAVAVRGKGGLSGRIYAGSEPVMTLGGRGWRSVAAAREVAQRLSALAEEGLRPKEIAIWTERRSRVIVARGVRVVTIDRTLAASQGADRASLARAWLHNLRTQFERPYLAMAPVLVPVGETRSALVKGNIEGELIVRAEEPLVSATWDRASRHVRVLGHAPGRTALILEDRENSLRVPVRAARYAAQWMESIPAAVTGRPASLEAVARAVKAAIGADTSVEPGAWASVMPWLKTTSPLWPGRSAAVPAQISAGGPEYLSYHARPVITVRNEAVPSGAPELLMVSNSPERLPAHGLWFEGKIADESCVRFLYHHVNSARTPADLVVELWNLGEGMARVQVVAGTAGPSYDEVWVGHRAASEFLVSQAADNGWILPVPPGCAMPVVSEHMRPGAVVSGVLQLRALGPANLSLRLYLAPSASERMPRAMENYVPSPLLGHGHYPGPLRAVKARYQVGGDWAFVTIGERPAAGLVYGDLLEGSYGVLYDIDLELANLTAEPARVAVLLEPAGGPARGALLVDGRPRETALLSNNAEGLVERYSLAPGQTRRVRIQTMPQGGSNYPVRLVARPD